MNTYRDPGDPGEPGHNGGLQYKPENPAHYADYGTNRIDPIRVIIDKGLEQDPNSSKYKKEQKKLLRSMMTGIFYKRAQEIKSGTDDTYTLAEYEEAVRLIYKDYLDHIYPDDEDTNAPDIDIGTPTANEPEKRAMQIFIYKKLKDRFTKTRINRAKFQQRIARLGTTAFDEPVETEPDYMPKPEYTPAPVIEPDKLTEEEEKLIEAINAEIIKIIPR